MPGPSELWLATSNDHKFEEARFVMEGLGIALRRIRSKGLEIQSDDPRKIALHAANEASARLRRPLATEDTGLFIRALGGFPGTYASQAFSTLSLIKVLKLMPQGRRQAEFISAVAYCDGKRLAKVFTGSLKGSLSPAPRGEEGFGFDPIFVPVGQTRTLGEMTIGEKCAISHRSAALRALGEWLLSRPRG